MLSSSDTDTGWVQTQECGCSSSSGQTSSCREQTHRPCEMPSRSCRTSDSSPRACFCINTPQLTIFFHTSALTHRFQVHMQDQCNKAPPGPSSQDDAALFNTWHHKHGDSSSASSFIWTATLFPERNTYMRTIVLVSELQLHSVIVEMNQLRLCLFRNEIIANVARLDRSAQSVAESHAWSLVPAGSTRLCCSTTPHDSDSPHRVCTK